MNDCIFCKIISRESPAQVIAENDDVIVFVSKSGHPLVVPKRHIKDIYELDDETGAAIAKQLVRTAKAVKKGLGSDGVYLTQANEPAAGQDVFHLHFHLYPRWHAAAKNQAQRIGDDLRRLTMERVRAAYE
jgi:histidine triad (HIT) family protein